MTGDRLTAAAPDGVRWHCERVAAEAERWTPAVMKHPAAADTAAGLSCPLARMLGSLRGRGNPRHRAEVDQFSTSMAAAWKQDG